MQRLFVGVFLCFAAAFGQPAPVFEVVSIKPSAPGGRGGIIRPMPGNQTYMANNMPLQAMMTVAYSVSNRQISGGPDWVATEPFDMTAKADRRCATEELHVLLQKLLEERFQLKLRHEQREMPVWDLVVDKGGSKMPQHDPNDIDRGPMTAGPNRRGLSGKNLPMNYFALVLSRLLDRNVVDKTGLPGYWDVTIDFVRDPLPGAPLVNGEPPPAGDGPSIFTALREQLGLRLVSSRGPVDYLVIESVERPSAN